jgi:hypothetical protein
MPELLGKDYRSGRYGSGKATASGFVGAGFEGKIREFPSEHFVNFCKSIKKTQPFENDLHLSLKPAMARHTMRKRKDC